MSESDTKAQNGGEEEDITFESELDADNAKDPAEMIKSLKEKLKLSQKERQEYLEGWQRTKADYANARKDEDKSRAEFVKFSKEEVIRDVLPALDSFHIAFGNKEAWEKVDLNWRMGVQYIYSQLLKILEEQNVKIINPLGEDYNPTLHEAIELVPVKDELQDGKILTVMNKGYSINGKIVRAPKVKVGELKK